MAQTCGDCGSEVAAQDTFCGQCGRPVNGAPAAPQPRAGDEPVPQARPSWPQAPAFGEVSARPGEGRCDYHELRRGHFAGYISCFAHGRDLYVFESARATVAALQSAVVDGAAGATAELNGQSPHLADPVSVTGLDID